MRARRDARKPGAPWLLVLGADVGTDVQRDQDWNGMMKDHGEPVAASNQFFEGIFFVRLETLHPEGNQKREKEGTAEG